MTALALAEQTQQDKHLTAVIEGPDGIRFLATAACPAHLAAQIVEYVLGRCDDVLWQEDAAAVRALVAAQQPYAAIAMYFARVGLRWDDERLELSGITFQG